MPSIRISRRGFVWWFLGGGPLGAMHYLVWAVLSIVGVLYIASGSVLEGIAMILLMPFTLLISAPLWVLWIRAIKPAARRIIDTIFEVTD